MGDIGTTAAAINFLNLSQQLLTGQITESALPQLIAAFPPLDQTLLQTLAAEAQHAALSQPRRSWAMMATAAAAAQQTDDLFLQSLAAWHLARAANAWVRPQRVEAAVARAQEGFAALGREDWLAACIWQLNALPWTRPNFPKAAAELAEALALLENNHPTHPLQADVADCRLSFAYANLLLANRDTAEQLVRKSEQSFQANNDLLGQGRCQLLLSSIMRRQNRYDVAEQHLQSAHAYFNQLNAQTFIAQTCFQRGFVAWLVYADFQQAESLYRQAAQIFQTADLQSKPGSTIPGHRPVARSG